jgi:hypothetical protein
MQHITDAHILFDGGGSGNSGGTAPKQQLRIKLPLADVACCARRTCSAAAGRHAVAQPGAHTHAHAPAGGGSLGAALGAALALGGAAVSSLLPRASSGAAHGCGVGEAGCTDVLRLDLVSTCHGGGGGGTGSGGLPIPADGSGDVAAGGESKAPQSGQGLAAPSFVEFASFEGGVAALDSALALVEHLASPS